MPKLYISVDVETSGPTPGKYSLLSIGACVVGDTSKQFYRELKPLTTTAIPEALKVCVPGFRNLDQYRNEEEFNPLSRTFSPQRVMTILSQKGEEPSIAMADFANWINQVSVGFDPIESAAPIKFDGMFTSWYFDQFCPGQSPLGYRGEDISSLYRGVTGNMQARLEDLGLRKNGLPHNALEDAIIQAQEMEAVLELMKKSTY